MAGIGFQLKKLYYNNGKSSLRAVVVSAIIAEGPMILGIIMLFLIRWLITSFQGSYSTQELYLVTISDAMIFSLLLSNTVLLFVNRYISDCLYKKQDDRIMPVFFFVASCLCVVGSLLCIAFLSGARIELAYKVLVVVLQALLLVVWTQVVFITATKNLKKIVFGFLMATVVSVVSSAVLMLLKISLLYAALIGTILGFFVMTCMFMAALFEHFPLNGWLHRDFFYAVTRYKSLFLTGFLMILGLYAANFIIWGSKFGTVVLGIIPYCIKYDIPSFYASITMLPSMIFFVVSIETNFYDKYQDYYNKVRSGTLSEIKESLGRMTKVLINELWHIAIIQLAFTLAAAFIGAALLSVIGFDNNMLEIFRVLCFGYYFYIFNRLLVLLMLYFDDRLGALLSSLIFFAVCAAVTFALMRFGIDYYGIGFFAAAILTTIVSFVRLMRYINNINFYTFCRQPVYGSLRKGLVGKLADGIFGLTEKRKELKGSD